MVLPWVESVIVLLIIGLGIFIMFGGIHCAQRANSQAIEQSEAYDRIYPPGTRRPSWVPPRIVEPPMVHYRNLPRELMYSVAMTTCPGRILARTYPLTSPLAYPPGLTPSRTDHPSWPAPDAGRMV